MASFAIPPKLSGAQSGPLVLSSLPVITESNLILGKFCSVRGCSSLLPVKKLLIGINILKVSPGAIDRSTLGHPGKISYCISEDEENSGWSSLAESRDIPKDASAVTVLAAGAPRQIMNEWTTKPEEILDTYAAEMRANMRNYSIWAGNYVVIMPPQHREHMKVAGWGRQEIANYLFEKARIKRSEWSSVGKGSVVRDKADIEYCALPSPDHLLLIAAGGPAGGFGAIIPPWLGTKSQAITLAIGSCVDCDPSEEN